MAMLADRIDQLSFELSKEAGKEPLQDRYLVGCIAAYNDLLGIDMEELNHG